jgi:hypothetical protein
MLLPKLHGVEGTGRCRYSGDEGQGDESGCDDGVHGGSPGQEADFIGPTLWLTQPVRKKFVMSHARDNR